MKKNSLLIISILLTACLFSGGCATVSTEQAAEDPIFYPPLPDEPRFQFLTSFSSSRDVEGDSSGFAKFVLGDDVPLKPIVKPYGVTLRDGKIYVCDTVINGLEIIDLKKKTFEYFKPQGSGRMMDPINMDLSPDGEMYVADARRGQVLIFNSNRKYINAIGLKSELKPSDVAIQGDKVFVCDIKSRSIRVYNRADNSFLYSIPKEGQGDDAKLFTPTNIDIDLQGNIYVSDTGGFTVKKYAEDGTLIKSYGTLGDAPGQFARPKGIAVDKEERIYIVDAAFENVQVFDGEGNLLLYFPEPQGPASLGLPAGIDIDYDNVEYFKEFAADGFEIEYVILVVSQYGERKIGVFGFGSKD